MSPHDAMAADLRACRAAAQAAAKLLTVLDQDNAALATTVPHDWVGNMLPAGLAMRWQAPGTESAMCELRAALAEVKL